MAISALPLPTPDDLVADAAASLHALARHDWEAEEDLDLVSVVEALQGLRAVAFSVEARVLAQVDARDVAKDRLSWGSTAEWYTHLAGVRRGQGKKVVDHATKLVTNRQATLNALTEGLVSPEQADVLLNAVDRLPADNELRDAVEREMLDEASRVTATELARHGRSVIETVDPDRTARTLEAQLAREDRVSHQRRFLSITEDGAGGVLVKGRGSLEDAAVLRAAVLPLTAPVPEMDPETCQDLPDRRDFGVRMWDALVQVAQHALDSELPPESHGARPRVAVSVGLEALRGTLFERGRTDDGLDVSPEVARRLACDADIVPMVLGTAGEVLDVGRTRRLVTAPLWRALVERDRHCAFPGCTRPPVMCHAHHVVAWFDGGPTSLANLVLLCGHHHRTVHQTPWEVRIGEDGRPDFRPPPRFGVARDWIRHRPRVE